MSPIQCIIQFMHYDSMHYDNFDCTNDQAQEPKRVDPNGVIWWSERGWRSRK